MSARILVLEDNAYLAPPLIRLLTRTGYDVTHVDCCAKARAIDGYFDLGVFDLELADGAGIEVGTELLENGNLGAVVFFTATLDRDLFQRARRLAPCVLKTDGIETLLGAIRGALISAPRRLVGGGDGRRRKP